MTASLLRRLGTSVPTVLAMVWQVGAAGVFEHSIAERCHVLEIEANVAVR